MRWTHREQPAQCYMISIKPITHRMSVHISVRDCTTPQRTARACPQGCKPPQEDLVQMPDQLRTPEAARGSRMRPSLPHAALHRPTPHPIEAPGHHLSPPRHRSTVGMEPLSAGLLFSPLASQFHLNRIASASTNDAHKLTMLNVSNLTSHFLVNSVKFLCFITDSYSRRACVK